jgi:hypothetical protein
MLVGTITAEVAEWTTTDERVGDGPHDAERPVGGRIRMQLKVVSALPPWWVGHWPTPAVATQGQQLLRLTA